MRIVVRRWRPRRQPHRGRAPRAGRCIAVVRDPAAHEPARRRARRGWRRHRPVSVAEVVLGHDSATSARSDRLRAPETLRRRVRSVEALAAPASRA
jgi:hypothetical protein